jgi:hypothetical protein
VSISEADGSTKIRVEEDLRDVAGGIYGGVVGSIGANALLWSILAPLLFHAPLWLPVLLVGVIGLTYGIVRTAFGAFVRARRRNLAELVEKLAAEAASEGRAAPVRVEGEVRTRVAEGAPVDVNAAAAEEEQATVEDASERRR